MATSPKTMDRRVQRTRQLLKRAASEVISEKGFEAASVQDITDRANVNRGTFYAHFVDKYALLEAIIRERFQLLLADQIPTQCQWDRQAMLRLIQSVLEYYEDVTRRCRMSSVTGPFIERAVHEELTNLFLAWLKYRKGTDRRGAVPVETIAQVMSWSVFGAALRWSQDPSICSSEQMASDVLRVIFDGVGNLVPGVLLA